jgi:hypothetical protein
VQTTRSSALPATKALLSAVKLLERESGLSGYCTSTTPVRVDGVALVVHADLHLLLVSRNKVRILEVRNKPLKGVQKFKYFGTKETDTHCGNKSIFSF